MERIAICTGSFDPPTYGHINIIERGLKLFDRIIIAVATNTTKKTTFTPEERVTLLKEIFKETDRVIVESFHGLLAEYVKQKRVTTLLRGIRNMSDYEYESQMALANKTLSPEIETIFMMTEGKYAHLSSSIIKEIIAFGGSGGEMIHPVVEKRLREKLCR
ncbi:MAG: pantetheine-phosphate adenylyltransferase [Deltaproteobacteria bacterium RIFCSPLOWO2_02_FULL_44_10]|nr:MAG: pantetheine-phosphate adenylyltransferase [Deltaproteobacteria bacterium RIFCSPHIGHO2_02_FULL_44_16]OGQ45457.1 MAG: pantetheine-phosphate adenylyltransferase [Deltaproteobacteria bacterium RIFCSPLOWO2_02_FULL_44_10]